MGEDLADVVLRLSEVLRWLGKYEESNTLVLLSRLLRVESIRTEDQFEFFVLSLEGRPK